MLLYILRNLLRMLLYPVYFTTYMSSTYLQSKGLVPPYLRACRHNSIIGVLFTRELSLSLYTHTEQEADWSDVYARTRHQDLEQLHGATRPHNRQSQAPGSGAARYLCVLILLCGCSHASICLQLRKEQRDISSMQVQKNQLRHALRILHRLVEYEALSY